MAESEPKEPSRSLWPVAAAVGLVVLLAAAGTALYLIVTTYALLPRSSFGYFKLALVVGLGLLAVILVGRIVHAVVERFAGKRHAGLIDDIYRIVAYTALALVALYALGINGYALLAGGTFAGLVIGLASATALSNFVAGVVLLVARPFEPGDRLTFASSQFGMLLPSYPPKFYSDDLLIPGFTGTVQDIGLMYTELRLDTGPRVMFPNSIVLQGAVISHELNERWVRVRYEVPPAVDPTRLLPAVRDAVAQDDWVVGKKSVRVLVNAGTIASYVISVDALCAGNAEEPPRSAIWIRIRGVVESFAPPSPAPSHGSPLPPPGQPSPASTPPPPSITPLSPLPTRAT